MNAWRALLCRLFGHAWAKKADRWGLRHCDRCQAQEMLDLNWRPK